MEMMMIMVMMMMMDDDDNDDDDDNGYDKDEQSTYETICEADAILVWV